MEQPSARATFISKAFFCWAIPLLYDQYKSKTSKKFEYLPLNQHKSNLIGTKLEKNWLNECQRNEKNPKLWRALLETFYKPLICLGLLFVLNEFAFKITQPWFIGKLMEQYSKTTKTNNNNIYLYGSLLILANLLNTLVTHFYLFQIQHLGMKIRIACCSLIYRKILRLHPVSLLEMGSSGKMINLISNDVNRFDMAPMFFFQLIIAPIETVIIIYCLYTFCGPTTITGIVFLLLFVPFQMFLGKLASQFRMKTATKTDLRISIINEIISAIRLIKMCGWENLFAEKVTKARKIEINQIKLASYLRALNSSFMIFMNRTGIFLCIATYTLIEKNKQLDAKYVFIVSGFFAILRQALTVYFPNGINNFFETKVSISRIEYFLLLQEIQNNHLIQLEQDEETQMLLDEPSEVTINTSCRILLENISIKWPNFAMERVNFELHSNEFIILTGSVGSGKSSLLLSILKQTTISQGRVSINGKISYASQEPWLFSDTIKNNIIFQSDLNADKYKTILNVCGLIEDLKSFPYGDETQVGENGILLSGGQRARINLARAIYREADIYLLDDPMSAVDLNVARHIFNNCILEYLKNKSVVLITSDQQFINNSMVRKVYETKSNTLVLQTTNNLEHINNSCSYLPVDAIQEIKAQEKIKLKNEPEKEKNNKIGSKRVYEEYRKSGSGNNQLFTIIILLLAFLSTQALASGVDYFPAYWANLNNSNLNEYLLIIYMSMIIGCIIVTTSRSIIFFKFCNKASYVLHKKMFLRLIMAHLTFFNANSSSGQILNRFTKDMGFVDEYLPTIIMDTLQIAFIISGSILLVIYLSNWIICPTILMMGLFYFLRILFLKTSRILKHNETRCKSPIFSYIRESLQGLPTIRSFNVENSQIQQFDRLQDCHSSAFYIYLSCNRAFGFWIDLICVFYTIIVFIAIGGFYDGGKAGNVGLAITQTINLIGLVQWGLRQWTELENQMVSVERIVEYSQIETEKDNNAADEEKLHQTTNNNGREITFKSVAFKYHNTNNYILKDLTFSIKPNEKIGIVGRTGAGKTCLITLLLRLFEFEGEILIDNLNINKISLQRLRSNIISIIPQDPILFTGSLRENLDPLNQFKDDQQIWRVLDEVQLKEFVLSLPGTLYFEISENGSNFSIGQRQLLCLARAFLKDSKILILDEATANVDEKTSDLIQEIVMSKPACTVLSVAHRLQTILNTDRVLVLANGLIQEFDSPRRLLENKNSAFFKLLNDDDD